MKILDTAMTEIVRGNSTRYYSKYVVDGKEHTDTLNNFKFLNMINPNNEITIGNTCSSGVTFSIYMPTISLENKEITIFEGVKVGTEIKYIKLGIFTVTKQTSDGEYTSYEAYDRMYKADMPYFSDMAFPNTDKAILNEICGKLGISLATNIATAHTINDKPQGYTYREIIGYMAMLQGCNAVINSDGNLELRWYKDSGYVLDGHKYYQQGVTFTTSKDFIIQKLTCNNTKSGSTEQSEITSGDGATGLSFANPFMTQAILDEVYKKIGGFTFRPLTVKFVGDYRLEVGDIITVNKGGVDYKVPIMQITHECDGGLMDTVTSIGQSDTENTSVASGPITKQMERYYADLILVNKALINKLSVDEADIRYASIETLKAVNADIDNLKTNKLDATYADIINANVESLKAANAEIMQLKANSLTADIADLKYAQIDFANVKGQVVTTSLIKDGAVTNEKVQSLSANKLTAGTIDASKITVTNLNADNITVGTINGKRIGTGSLSLDKLAEEVPTKEYLDKVQEDLQGQIDGNIETFTKTEIPTLNNEPAINWKDNATKNKHIGDICYVVNPASSADGYSYRFADTGTLEAPNYEWVLIKDSDVTKALQDIININGEITGIKKFNVEISSWKTDTDSELSSLKTRTTSLETDMSNKVDTTTFNEVKQTVDENSSTITKMSETLSKKADSSTVTTLSNTVNSIKQTTDTNTSSISSLTSTVEKKANQDEVTNISNKLTTVEQNLNGLTVDVTNQYQYIDNQLNGNHKIYEIAHAPTKDNYPTNEWSIQIYPSDNIYPSDDIIWQYTEDEYEKYVGTIAYWKDQQRAWRFIRKSDGTHDWVEISATETTYLLNQNASLRIDVNNISTSLSSLTTNIQNNYSTTTQMNNAITQAITSESNSIKLEVSGTYATKDSVANTLKSYATTASLAAYIKKDPTSGELKSAIEAIADDITLNASGTINISGNKSVNINGNLFTLTSTNTTISADGTIRCDNLISSNAKITGGSININTSGKNSSYMTLNYDNYAGRYSPYATEHIDGTYSTALGAQTLSFFLTNGKGLATYDYNGVYLTHDDYNTSLTKNLRLNDGDCYVYGYYYISSGGAWVELSEWIKQKLGI
jgi:predicted  nucleic acid-binding Zn-ribbon protein|nr:MAG TPA: Minor structural protein [Bacteriophage sp.]